MFHVPPLGLGFCCDLSNYEIASQVPRSNTQWWWSFALDAFLGGKVVKRFHLKTRNDRRLAEKIIRRALERDRSAVIEAFDFAIKSNISDAEKLQFSQRKLDFLEDLSYDINVDRDRESSSRRYSDRNRYSDHRDSRDSYRDNHRGVRDNTGYCMPSNSEIPVLGNFQNVGICWTETGMV
ncbi:hypothetical protein ANCCEY_11739 [Ancylostoma ceylanicum]|uniref:Uncharacterized protein n=1 Tax=Ancylostoma ceylanicum TaxID=53326 RepID=A0A0D6LD36_9BILA|nr:hypothetical protein ANCCEY_11739 [Ancylostoma ceylanicum]